MGEETDDADLSYGAVAAMSQAAAAEGLRPVLQVVSTPRQSVGAAEQYQLLLSDGVDTLLGSLAASLNQLVTGGDLCRGTIVRILHYSCSELQGQRVITVIQLEILQTEHALIGSPTINEAYLTQTCSGGLGSLEHCFLSAAQNVVDNLSGFPGKDMSDSSFIPRAEHAVTPVTALNPYKSGWDIKARVTAKTDLRLYGNERGPGKVFSFDLIDAQSGEIRVTCFNLQADQYFDLIEVDKVYLMSGGTLKPAPKNSGTLNGHYEIFADNSTSIQVCSDDDSSIPGQQYDFIQIREIWGMENGSMVDLIAVVTSVSHSTTIMWKDGTGIQKRTIRLKDMSNRSMDITFSGKFCDREGQELQCLFESGSNPILAIKGCRVTVTSLTTISSTHLKINPDLPEAETLRQWYLTETAAQEMSSDIRNHIIRPIAVIKDENLGRSDRPDLITVRARILQVDADNFCYPACTLLRNGWQCNTMVTRNNDGTWNCKKCAMDLPNCEYRYVMTCQLQDHTGITKATVCREVGTKIIGCSAEELLIAKEQDEAKWEEIMLRVYQQEYLFKLSVHDLFFNDERFVKCNIVGAVKLDA